MMGVGQHGGRGTMWRGGTTSRIFPLRVALALFTASWFADYGALTAQSRQTSFDGFLWDGLEWP